MYLSSIFLQHFRSYQEQKFSFSPDATIIIGPNTAGKTNLVEALHLLVTGKTFRSGSDNNMIHNGQTIGRVQGLLESENEKQKREVTLIAPSESEIRFRKRYLVNGIPKSRNYFMGDIPIVLFHPEDLDIIIGSPSHRRNFLDGVLEQVDKDYAYAVVAYEKALRQRNALLGKVQETGQKNPEEFQYWDSLLIDNGSFIHAKRAAFIAFLNTTDKTIFPFSVMYDHSLVSEERLLHYANAEIGAGVTLVGPHRDDVQVFLPDGKILKDFGSRGQQRLAVLQLKLLQIHYMQEKGLTQPLFILDDIFSELDKGHIELLLEKLQHGQRIITTTHKEFIPEDKLPSYTVIELEKRKELGM